MGAKVKHQRGAWSDRFRRPEAAALLAGLGGASGTATRHARAQLLGIEGVRERVVWRGVWKWTLCYEFDGQGKAFLVPDPAKPLLCVPLDEDALSAGGFGRASKGVREGLAAAPVVGSVRWGTWALTSIGLVDEVCAISGLGCGVAQVR